MNLPSRDVTDQMDDGAMEAEADECVDDSTTEADADDCSLSSGEQADQREEPLGSVNGKPETDDKNQEARSTEGVQAGRYAAEPHDALMLEMSK